MAQLGIRGHATRGKEVIEILEMLGGMMKGKILGTEVFCAYYIDSDGSIDYKHYSRFNDAIQFTLEEFLEKFPYKVGDKVKVKETGKDVTIDGMSWRNGCEVIYDTCYNNDCVSFHSAEELQPYEEETMESKPNILQQLKEYFDNTPRDVIEKEWEELSYLNEIGPTVNEYLECVKKYRQSNQYPKTYEECCEVLGVNPSFDIKMLGDGESTLYFNFIDLVRCRNAYWKIAGEQKGLGKPWKPDWSTEYETKYVIEVYRNKVRTNSHGYSNTILAFPTAEMRDAFQENFWVLIELCKELL